MAKAKRKNSDIIAVYRPSLFNQLFAFGGMLVIVLLIIPAYRGDFGDQPDSIPGTIFMVGLCAVMLWGFFEVIARDKLILHKDGIAWRETGTEHDYTWEQMRRFTLKTDDKNTYWGIRMSDGKFLALDHFIMLPALPFQDANLQKMRRLRKHRVGQTLYKNASHLFDDLKQKAK